MGLTNVAHLFVCGGPLLAGVPSGYYWSRGRVLPCPKGSYRSGNLSTTNPTAWTCRPCGSGITTSGNMCKTSSGGACADATACNRESVSVPGPRPKMSHTATQFQGQGGCCKFCCSYACTHATLPAVPFCFKQCLTLFMFLSLAPLCANLYHNTSFTADALTISAQTPVVCPPALCRGVSGLEG